MRSTVWKGYRAGGLGCLLIAVTVLAGCGRSGRDFETVQAKAQTAVDAAAEVVRDDYTITPSEAHDREECEHSITLKPTGTYRADMEFELRAADQAGLDAAAAAIEARWKKDGWTVVTKRYPDSPVRHVRVEQDGYSLSAVPYEGSVDSLLKVGATTPCAKPRKAEQ